MVIKSIMCTFFLLRPDERFVGIGKTNTAEIGHGIRLYEYNIVQNPEAQILQNRSEAIDIVLCADHPECAGIFQDALASGEPEAGEAVIFFKV